MADVIRCKNCETLIDDPIDSGGFCSDECADEFYDRRDREDHEEFKNEEVRDGGDSRPPRAVDDDGDFYGEDFLSRYDDDPSPYDGTYSEE